VIRLERASLHRKWSLATNRTAQPNRQGNSAVSGKTGIRIDADSVTLDLGGFAMLGVSGSLSGILINTHIHVAVREGSISGWGIDGLDGTTSGLARIDDLRVDANAGIGLVINDIVAGNPNANVETPGANFVLDRKRPLANGSLVSRSRKGRWRKSKRKLSVTAVGLQSDHAWASTGYQPVAEPGVIRFLVSQLLGERVVPHVSAHHERFQGDHPLNIAMLSFIVATLFWSRD
jgi:hypothetical protein